MNLCILERDFGTNPGPGWLTGPLDHFRAEILDPAYPCIFGRRALKAGDIYLTWVSGRDLSGLDATVDEFVSRTATEKQGRAPLAIFVEPDPAAVDQLDHDAVFWSILQHLHDRDPGPWPRDVPEDPGEEGWQFSFAGCPMFVFALTPANRLRRSRYSRCLVVMLLPKSVFSGIEVGTPVGNTARISIRNRLEAWDPLPFHPSIGTYDLMSVEEWRQFLIPDDGDLHQTCPLRGARAVSGLSSS